jgi:ribosomal protein S17
MVMIKKKMRKTIMIRKEENMTKNRYEGEGGQLLQKKN